MKVIFYGIIFFSIPILTIIAFIVSLCRYIYAKKKNKAVHGTFSDETLKSLKSSAVTFGITAGVFVAIIIGIAVWLGMAVAYM